MAVVLLSVVLIGVTFPNAPARGQSQPDAGATESAARVELVFWESIMHSANPAEFHAYLKRWPDGTFAELARLRLSALQDATPATTTTQPEAEWSLYENARFGTRVRFPGTRFVAQPPPENGDGRRFLTPDGMAGFLVFGQHDIFGRTPDEALGAALRDGAYDQVRLQRVLPNAYEYTALQGNRLLHRRMLIDQDQGLIHVFEGFYPAAQEGEFAPLMERIALSLETAAAPASAMLPQAAIPPPPPPQPAAYQTPSRDTALRRALLDAARVPIEADLGRPFLFRINTLRTAGDWAFVMGTPLETDASRFDWMRTPFARDWQADMMSDLVMVLLVRQDGRWRALEHVIGPTDVHWAGWVQSYNLPEVLFYAP